MNAKLTFSRVPLLALMCVMLTTAVFSPHLWLLDLPDPGTFLWSRGLSFLKQCNDPFDKTIETAMHWRLLPPFVARALGLTGYQPFILPWLGIVALASYVVEQLRRVSDNRRFILGGTLIFTSTSACLVPIGWLGVNDAWVWLGLLIVSFTERPWAVMATCLLCPWVDERFIIGLPLALMVRTIHFGRSRTLLRDLYWTAGLLPYVLVRLGFGDHFWGGMTSEKTFLKFVWNGFRHALPLYPLACWMGLRIAWAPIGYVFATLDRIQRALLIAITIGTVLVSFFLAFDLSRSIAILCPLIILGLLQFRRDYPEHSSRIVFLGGIIALILPAAHVVYTTIYPISNILIELIRWVRH